MFDLTVVLSKKPLTLALHVVPGDLAIPHGSLAPVRCCAATPLSAVRISSGVLFFPRLAIEACVLTLIRAGSQSPDEFLGDIYHLCFTTPDVVGQENKYLGFTGTQTRLL